MNAILKYTGAKWSIADWIIGHFPKHHSYLEPFFGSGAVFFRKDPSNIETVNDIDGEVVNLFECIKSDPERIARSVFFIPYSRQIFELTYNKAVPEDPFDRAMKFLTKCNMGFGYRTNERRVGWKRDVSARERAYAAEAWKNLPDVIIEAAERLRGVQIECTPAVKLIERFNSPDVLIYCDPPYLLSTRRGKQYRCEMTEDDHLELLEVLKRHKGPALISGYQNDMYDNELAGWAKESISSTDQLSQMKREVLWMNFEPIDQMKMF